MEVAIYRILQEALNNVKKHADATEVDVLAQFTEKEIGLIVQDNGRGFIVPDSITDFASIGGFGVMGLHERAQLFGGHIVVESQPFDGTTIRMLMPRQSNLVHLEIRNNATPFQNSQRPPESLVIARK
jgi:signal transduction histidine kinase